MAEGIDDGPDLDVVPLQKGLRILCILVEVHSSLKVRLSVEKVQYPLFLHVVLDHFGRYNTVLVGLGYLMIQPGESPDREIAGYDIHFAFLTRRLSGVFVDEVPYGLHIETILGISVDFVVNQHRLPFMSGG